MLDSDRKDFMQAMTAVYALYRVDVSDGVIGIWWQALKQFDLAAIKDALGRHAVNPDAGQFLPKPADVVKMLKGSTLDSALQAWTKVQDAIRHVGTYATVAFDDPLIHRVIEEMGGWVQLGKVTEKEWPFTQKQFEARYRAYKARSELPEYPPRLYGIADGQNMSQGYAPQGVVLIGNHADAKAVLAGGSDRPRLPVFLEVA